VEQLAVHLRSVRLMRRIIMKLSKRLSLRFLRQQQAQLELQLTEPNLSTAETRRLERQKAYWGRVIEQTLALPC